ncbi:hypothetical protein B0I35DRAFT_106417 [Stachybotrys elegans]|uniref:Uncharacterized protein n=1 Tax=Stachybotrys elegans TaxID=80388 RepID=A0A8K0SKP4_9HYPO|nr:hypothetical protein B0I35DRAFT_106417 [Stachybotrys elegans]
MLVLSHPSDPPNQSCLASDSPIRHATSCMIRNPYIGREKKLAWYRVTRVDHARPRSIADPPLPMELQRAIRHTLLLSSPRRVEVHTLCCHHIDALPLACQTGLAYCCTGHLSLPRSLLMILAGRVAGHWLHNQAALAGNFRLSGPPGCRTTRYPRISHEIDGVQSSNYHNTMDVHRHSLLIPITCCPPLNTYLDNSRILEAPTFPPSLY